MKKPSQTASYGPMLTSEQLYTACVGSAVQWTPEHEQALVERARCGDMQARDEIILGLWHPVQRYAFRYVTTYQWVSTPLDALDLAQEGTLALMECFDKALRAENPIVYLLGCAYKVIQWHCFHCSTLIVSPGGAGSRWLVESLDCPLVAPAVLDGDEYLTLADVLMAPSCVPVPLDETPLVEAIDILPPKAKEVMWRWSGFAETGAETIQEIADGAMSDSQAYNRTQTSWHRGRRILRNTLKAVYPQRYAQCVSLLPPQTARREVCLSKEQRQRLALAWEVVQARGQKVTGRTLMKEAKIGAAYARAYLRERQRAADLVTEVA